MPTIDLTSREYLDRVRGCWIGKNAGGTLGTPIEEALGREEPFDIWWYPELQEGGLPNDDLEMQLVWLAALEESGPRLRAADLARYWLDHIGYNFDEYGLSKTNLRLGLQPPVSGAFNNWFVDCMGSPIRTEIWACVAPGAPRVAARLAFEDAICDHAGGESVYGSLFNAAIQSAAFVVQDRRELIDIGLTYIPESSRTALAVRTAVAAHADGVDWKTARRRVLAATPSHVAQYSPVNIGFQVIGLLYGRDFGDALCITVNCGYDTDSSTGTTGSWWGIIDGAAALPQKWIEPFGEEISTNESWGGVRHLSDGARDIPQNLTEVVERVAGAARIVLADAGLLRDDAIDTMDVDPADLRADDAVRALWDRDPMTIVQPGPQFTLEATYPGTPAVAGDATAVVRVRVTNPHPDSVDGVVEGIAPASWSVSGPLPVTVAPGSTVEVELSVTAPPRAGLENTNPVYLAFRADGYPFDAPLPLPFVGAVVMEASPQIALGDRDAAAAAAVAAAGDTPIEGWRLLAAPGNALPAEAMPEPGRATLLRLWFHAPRRTAVRLGVDASARTRAWLGGDQILDLDRTRPLRPSYAGATDGYVDTELAEGWNTLVVELTRGEDDPVAEAHVVASTGDRLHHGLPLVGRTRTPWDTRP